MSPVTDSKFFIVFIIEWIFLEGYICSCLNIWFKNNFVYYWLKLLFLYNFCLIYCNSILIPLIIGSFWLEFYEKISLITKIKYIYMLKEITYIKKSPNGLLKNKLTSFVHSNSDILKVCNNKPFCIKLNFVYDKQVSQDSSEHHILFLFFNNNNFPLTWFILYYLFNLPQHLM